MKHSVLFDYSDDTFKQFVIVSLALHLSLVLGVSVKNFLLPSRVIQVPSSVRIDVVDLPDKPAQSPPKPKTQSVAPAKEPKAKEPPKPKPKPQPAPVTKKESLKQTRDSQKKALERLQALQAIEKMESEIQSKEKEEAERQKVPQYKGNIISSGSSFTGLSQLRVNEYLENLTTRVREHWVLPQWLSGANLKAAVVVQLDERGYVVRKEIYATSGNSVFDSSCLAAVTDASPFDSPPNEVRGALIMIRFPFE